MGAYVLPYAEFRRLHRRAYAAQQRDHEEVCGMLAASPGRSARLALTFLPNHSQRKGSFLLSLPEFKTARREAAASGLRPVGLFHSHPVGFPELGPRDKTNTPLNTLHLVYDVCGREPTLWRVVRPRRRRVAVEVPLRVQRSTNGMAR
jgi:proteasome lid subunit RPN8/RPN11